jgi:hypothetical protein
MGVAFCISHGSVMWNTWALRLAEGGGGAQQRPLQRDRNHELRVD